MQDVVARFKQGHRNLEDLPSKAVFQMNDTHPTIAVAELMRILIDQEGLDWDRAWGITVKVCVAKASSPRHNLLCLLSNFAGLI